MVKYAESKRYDVSDEEKHEILREIYQESGMKPWTLDNRVDAPREAIKQLLMDWYIQINADGDIILDRHKQ